VNRKQHILEVLAAELELKPGSRITTASLAGAVGVSEAALYRHFASKTQMFEALIEFAEESVFGLVNRILSEQTGAERRAYQIALVVLKFAERNPGIARILMGDILIGEDDRLRVRVRQFFERLEMQLRQVLREGCAAADTQSGRAAVPANANLILALVSGKIMRFVQGGFKRPPSEYWDEQWPLIANAIFHAVAHRG
jgi:TetR/AcrR family transcriptional regulator